MKNPNDNPQPETPDFSFLNSESTDVVPPEAGAEIRAAAARSRAATNSRSGTDNGMSTAAAGASMTSSSARPAAASRAAASSAADNQGNVREFGSRRIHLYITSYALALTLLMIILLVTGRLHLFGRHPLESLPDIRPLDSNEFQKVPDDAVLPAEHALRLGQSRRFGDVVLKPLKVTREPLHFVGFLDGQRNPTLTTQPVLKLWLEFTNVAEAYGFPPYDSGLMSWRSPAEETDQQVQTISANSYLKLLANGGDFVGQLASVAPDSGSGRRILNFLHSLNSNFVIADQNSGKVLMPGESLLTFVACSEEVVNVGLESQSRCVWRVHFRKGVHVPTGHGVTTLVDVHFAESDVETANFVQRETGSRVQIDLNSDAGHRMCQYVR